MKRKITSILAADVADFSRLVSEDEEDTLARLVAAQDVFKHHIVAHGGRIFNTAGDAILAEFPSAVEAVRAATLIQGQLERDNAALTVGRRLAFRMGISIGDVVEHGDDLLGDGVNIAARLQALAPAGGIAVSNWVHEQTAGKLTVAFHDVGRQTLKGITGAVQVFVADLAPAAVPRPETATRVQPVARPSVGMPKAVLAAGLGLLIVSAGYLALRSPPPTTAAVIVTPPAEPARQSPPPSSPSLPEPGPQGPASTTGSPETDRAPAMPVVLQPSRPRTPATDDATSPPPNTPKTSPITPRPIALPPVTPPTPSEPMTAPPVVTAAPTLPVVIPVPSPPEVTRPPAKSEPTPTPASLPSEPPPQRNTTEPAKSAEPARKAATVATPAKKEPGLDPKQRKQACREITERAQISDLSEDDRQFLRTQCR